MSTFYIKSNGKYIPIELNEVVTKDWENKLIAVKIGTDDNPANDQELEEAFDCLMEADAVSELEGSSFIISSHNVDFEVLDNLKDIRQKYISVRVDSTDDTSKLDELKSKISKQMNGKAKKTVFIPTPITVERYLEVKEILRRLDVRRSRRSR
jgi:hypothetical protein